MNFARGQPEAMSLSEVLRQQIITSPLLDWKNRKSTITKREQKSAIHENLSDYERSKRKKRREAKKTEVDLSDAIRGKLVGIKFAPRGYDVKTRKATEPKKANIRDGSKFPSKDDEFYQKSPEANGKDEQARMSDGSTVYSVGTKQSVETKQSDETKQSVASNDPSLRLITYKTWSKERSMFGTAYANPLRSFDASRHSRLASMYQSRAPSQSVQLKESSRVVGISSSAQIARPGRLERQHSTINLAPSFISASMASLRTMGPGEGSVPDFGSAKEASGERNAECEFPGLKPGEHCHSVAATIFKRKLKEQKLSSSSSSDDVFNSTRYARDVLEEKFRGITLEKTKHEPKESAPEKRHRATLHSTPKSKRKDQCKCKAHSHGKCLKGSRSNKKVPRKLLNMENSDDSQSSAVQDRRPKDSEELASKTSERAEGPISLSTGISNESFERPPPCNVETCPTKRSETGEGGEKKQPSPRSAGCSDKTISCGTEGSRRTILEPSASNGSLKPEVLDDPCTSKTCLFTKSSESLARKRKHKTHKASRSRLKHFHILKKTVCSYKTCKSPFGYPSDRFKRRRRAASRSGRSSSRSRSWHSRYSGRRRRNKGFICNCQNLYTGEKESSEEPDDIWLDADVSHSRTRRYKLSLETLGKRRKAKCGGFSTKGADCCCFVCKVKPKPWTKYMKNRKTLIDLPYLLTPQALNERAANTGEIRKTLADVFQWSEEDLKNFCTKHYVCKKPDTRKALLRDNPYLMKLCDNQKPAKEKGKAKVADTSTLEEQGKFGYFVTVLDDRLAMDETYGNLQTFAERAVYCKWHQDIAEMKVNHFLENMPQQQSCYSKPTHFDPDRRTCHNPKLIERLADLVQFNMKADRKIHEFSFPPKLLKYQEPQLVGDTRTEMPEIKILKEPGPFPTIYRDIFKTNKHDLRKLMDTLLPPLQWTDSIGFWEIKVSLEPDTVETNRNMINYLDENETLCHAINKKFCAGRYRLFFEVFAEVIRQELLEYPERAFLLSRIREEFLLTMLLYDGGLEMTVTSTTHLWKSVEAEAEAQNTQELELLEKEIGELKAQISEISALTYALEKRAEEQADSRGYLHEDDVKLYKKTNHQLNAQIEAIKAGYLFELD